MIRLYRGQVYAGLAVILFLCGFAAGYQVFVLGGVNGLWELFLLGVAMFSNIAGLVLLAFAYVKWVPKWERDEKRTGHVIGDRVLEREMR